MAHAKLMLRLLWLVALVVLVQHVDARCRGCTRNGRSKAKRGHYVEDCVFPFTFEGVEYNECAPSTLQPQPAGPQPWCATSLRSDGKNVESWKVCSQADNVSVNEVSPEVAETCHGLLCVRKCCPAGTHLDPEITECTPYEVSLWSPSTTFLKDRKDVDESKLQVLFGFPPGCSADDLVVVEGPFKLLPDDLIESASTSRYCLENVQDYGLLGVFCNGSLEYYEEM